MPCLRKFICRRGMPHTTAHAPIGVIMSHYSSPLRLRSRCGRRRTRRRVGKPGHADKAPLPPARTPHAEVGWHASGGGRPCTTHTHTHARPHMDGTHGAHNALYTRSKQETASRHQWSRHLPVNVLELHAGRSSAHRGLALCPSLHERRPDW